jgi:amidohydrolase
VRRAANRVVGAENVLEARTMASEDMGFILEDIPGCYFFLGAGNEEKGINFPHHHPRFDFDEEAMKIGVATIAEAVAEYVF